MSALQLYSMEIKYADAWFILSAPTETKLTAAFHALNPGVPFDPKLIEFTKLQKRKKTL